MERDCKNCVNCDYVRGFMCTCHYSYDFEENGRKIHVQRGQDVHRKQANKCDFYSEELYNRDEIFIL